MNDGIIVVIGIGVMSIIAWYMAEIFAKAYIRKYLPYSPIEKEFNTLVKELENK